MRFLGDVGYVVTFRQTDPLYTLDLSDPARPRVVGELKIPGYSAYLHPVGDGLLLGIGQDATDDGRAHRRPGLALRRVRPGPARAACDQAALGQGSSAVEYDHHAFLWWGPGAWPWCPSRPTTRCTPAWPWACPWTAAAAWARRAGSPTR